MKMYCLGNIDLGLKILKGYNEQKTFIAIKASCQIRGRLKLVKLLREVSPLGPSRPLYWLCLNKPGQSGA